MSRNERRLCVFFSAGRTRYALDALRVLEVARARADGSLQLPPESVVRDLPSLLGGEEERHAAAGVVVDGVPPLALRVKEVEGVFDCTGLPRWPVQGRLIPLLAPAFSGALEYEGRLIFELDADGAARGLPKQLKPLERHLRTDTSALVFMVEGERLAIPLQHVAQVIAGGACFNRSPNAGSFLGAALYRSHLCPIYTVGPLGVVGAFLVLFEVNGGLVGLSASRIEGVRSGASLEGAGILDITRMFT